MKTESNEEQPDFFRCSKIIVVTERLSFAIYAAGLQILFKRQLIVGGISLTVQIYCKESIV